MRPAFILALGLCIASLQPAFAGFQDQLVLSLGAGVGYPISTVQSSGDWGTGQHFSGSLGYILGKHQKYTLSASIDYTNYIRKILETNIIREYRSMDVMGVFVDFKMHLRQEEAIVNPYLKSGMGGLRLKTVDNMLESSDTQNQVGFRLGVGVDFALTKHGGLFVDAQYQFGLGSGKISQNIPFKVGLCIK